MNTEIIDSINNKKYGNVSVLVLGSNIKKYEKYNKFMIALTYSVEKNNYESIEYFIGEIENFIFHDNDLINEFINDIVDIIEKNDYQIDLLNNILKVSFFIREELGYLFVFLHQKVDCYKKQFEIIYAEMIERVKNDNLLASDLIKYLCDYDDMDKYILEISQYDMFIVDTITNCMKSNNNIYKTIIENYKNSSAIDDIIELNLEVGDYETISKIITKATDIYKLIENNFEDREFLRIVNKNLTLDLDILYVVTDGDFETIKIFFDKGNNATPAMIMAIEDQNEKVQNLLKKKADKSIFEKYFTPNFAN